MKILLQVWVDENISERNLLYGFILLMALYGKLWQTYGKVEWSHDKV